MLEEEENEHFNVDADQNGEGRKKRKTKKKRPPRVYYDKVKKRYYIVVKGKRIYFPKSYNRNKALVDSVKRLRVRAKKAREDESLKNWKDSPLLVSYGSMSPVVQEQIKQKEAEIAAWQLKTAQNKTEEEKAAAAAEAVKKEREETRLKEEAKAKEEKEARLMIEAPPETVGERRTRERKEAEEKAATPRRALTFEEVDTSAREAKRREEEDLRRRLVVVEDEQKIRDPRKLSRKEKRDKERIDAKVRFDSVGVSSDEARAIRQRAEQFFGEMLAGRVEPPWPMPYTAGDDDDPNIEGSRANWERKAERKAAQRTEQKEDRRSSMPATLEEGTPTTPDAGDQPVSEPSTLWRLLSPFHRGNGRVADLIKKDGLYSDQILGMMAKYQPNGFVGVVAADELSEVIKPSLNFNKFGFIMNKDKSTQPGSHWVAVYVDTVDDCAVEYYDSYANDPDPIFFKEIKKVIDAHKLNYYLKMKINRVKEQSENSALCGFHAMKFLIDRFKGKEFRECSGYSDVRRQEALAGGMMKKYDKFGYI